MDDGMRVARYAKIQALADAAASVANTAVGAMEAMAETTEGDGEKLLLMNMHARACRVAEEARELEEEAQAAKMSAVSGRVPA